MAEEKNLSQNPIYQILSPNFDLNEDFFKDILSVLKPKISHHVPAFLGSFHLLCKFIQTRRYLHKAIKLDVKNGCNVIRVVEESANYSVFS